MLWLLLVFVSFFFFFFFFNDTATTEIYTLSLHDALPIFPAGGNAVVAFARAGDGSLTFAGTFGTGGNGIGGTTDPLASQYSLILDGEDAKLLFVVNAGSNTV